MQVTFKGSILYEMGRKSETDKLTCLNLLPGKTKVEPKFNIFLDT